MSVAGVTAPQGNLVVTWLVLLGMGVVVLVIIWKIFRDK